MTSFLASLSSEQQEMLKNYRGPENHGDPTFMIMEKNNG
jgi:hypothetical protein